MSTLVMIGISHRTADLAQLERVAGRVAGDGVQREALAMGCAEVLVLSTCSRTEVYAALDPAGDDPDCRASHVAEQLHALLLDPASPGEPGRIRVGEDVVTHVCRVAAGLDSRITGEVEIQAQLRAAARSAQAQRGEPHRLRGLVAAALSGARSGRGSESPGHRRGLLAHRAVVGALGRFSGPSPVEVVVVGAGTMGRQVVEALPGHCRSVLLSRTPAAVGVRVRPLDELPARLATADVVFVATSAGRQILDADLVRAARHASTGRGLVLVDLSVPRNIDPAVADVPNVTLLDLDDLGDLPGQAGSLAGLQGVELAAAEHAARAAGDRYLAAMRIREAGPLIRAVRARIEQQCLLQLTGSTRGEPVSEEALLRRAATAAGALAHPPTMLIRAAAASGNVVLLAELASAYLDGEVADRVREGSA